MELNDLPDEAVNIIVITKMVTKLGRGVDEHSENLKMRVMTKYQREVTEPKNTICELKN